jgi:hypothetical protein
VSWELEYTDEFGEWWEDLTEAEQDSVDYGVRMLAQAGPGLRFLYSSSVRGSRHARMRELRVQHEGRPFRVFYAFDPRRVGLLLIGGDKTGNDRFYEEFTPIADKLYDEHLAEIDAKRS